MTDKYADLREATHLRSIFCSPEAIFGYRAAANHETIRALLADYDRLRDALLWNAAALNECCKECIREASNITIESETKCFSEILDMADAALAQEGS